MSSEQSSSRAIAEATAADSPWRSRLRVALIVGFGVLMLARIALPFVLEWMIPRVAARQNVTARVGNIDLGLLAGEITIDDLVVDTMPSGADAAENVAAAPPLLTLERVFVGFEWTGLLFERLHLTELDLVHPVVSLVQRGDGRLELPVPPVEQPADSPAPVTEDASGAEGGWTILLDRFALEDPELELHNEILGQDVVRIGAHLLGFDSLSIDADGIGVGEIDLERPSLFFERPWLLSLVSGAGESESNLPDEAEPTLPEPPARGMSAIQLQHLEIKGADFTVSTDEGPVEVELSLIVAEAGTRPGQTFPVELKLGLDEARIALDGRLGVNPVGFDGTLQWESLSVPPFLLLAFPKLVPWLESCDASGDLQLVFRSVADDAPAGLQGSGSAAIRDLSFRQPESGELAVAWDALELDVREAFVPLDSASAGPIRFELGNVALESPRFLYTNPPEALDELMAALESAPVSNEPRDAVRPEASTEGAQPTPIVEIDALAVRDGELRYHDRSVSPRHETRIRKLRTRIEGLATTPAPGAMRIEVDGLIQSKGSFEVRGGLPDGDGEIDFSLRELDLASYDSLARRAGIELQSGRTSLDSRIVASGGTYRTQNQLVLHDLDIALDQGSRFVDTFGMSLDVVLALLRDPSGDISLSIPVAIDAGGAGVDLGPIVTSAVRSAIQGAIASPVKMLGMLVPGDGGEDSLGAVPFPAGAAQLEVDMEDRLEALVELVNDRPMLALSLRGHWSDADRDPTALKMLTARAESGEAFPDVDGDGFFARRRIGAALVARAKGEPSALSAEDEALLGRYVAAQEVSESDLRALGEARARTLRTTLVELGAPETAVLVVDPAPSDVPNVSVELDARDDRVATSDG